MVALTEGDELYSLIAVGRNDLLYRSFEQRGWMSLWLKIMSVVSWPFTNKIELNLLWILSDPALQTMTVAGLCWWQEYATFHFSIAIIAYTNV